MSERHDAGRRPQTLTRAFVSFRFHRHRSADDLVDELLAIARAELAVLMSLAPTPTEDERHEKN